jgi:hypothetical protein
MTERKKFSPLKILLENGGKQLVTADNGGDFIVKLNKRDIKKFDVKPYVEIIGKDDTQIHRYITSFRGHTLYERVQLNVFQIEVTEKMTPKQEELYFKRATKTAQKDFEIFLGGNEKELGGMEIISPMAENSQKEINEIQNKTPFYRSKASSAILKGNL